MDVFHHAMKPEITVTVMLIASFIITYYLTMTLILRDNITDNRNKLYQALLMATWMALIELIMFGILMWTWNNFYTFVLLLLVGGILFLSWSIRNQLGIDKRQYYLSMIEHHQMAIDMSNLALHRGIGRHDAIFTKLAQDIITNQRNEIALMRSQLALL